MKYFQPGQFCATGGYIDIPVSECDAEDFHGVAASSKKGEKGKMVRGDVLPAAVPLHYAEGPRKEVRASRTILGLFSGTWARIWGTQVDAVQESAGPPRWSPTLKLRM